MIKIYGLVDNKTYIFTFYFGTQRDEPYKLSNKPFDVV